MPQCAKNIIVLESCIPGKYESIKVDWNDNLIGLYQSVDEILLGKVHVSDNNRVVWKKLQSISRTSYSLGSPEKWHQIYFRTYKTSCSKAISIEHQNWKYGVLIVVHSKPSTKWGNSSSRTFYSWFVNILSFNFESCHSTTAYLKGTYFCGN